MTEFTSEQEQAIRLMECNVAVSAGAGAGKTRVLVERYLHILATGQAETGAILAITFTNKAAKEMKERIRARAAELAAVAPTGEERQRWRRVKTELEYAPIGTFHSFCGRIIRENPVEAGIDPGFAVLDEVEADLLLETALTEVVTEGLAVGAAWLDRLLVAYDRPTLVALTEPVYDKLAGLGLVDENLAERLVAPYRQLAGGIVGLKDELRNYCQELIASKSCLNVRGPQFARVERLERDWTKIDAAIGSADDAAADVVLDEYLAKLDRRSKDKEIVTAIKEALRRLHLARADRTALALIPDWCRLLLALHERMERHKAETRTLAFGDLEIRAAELLRRKPMVRQKYQNRFRQIMVDEFQDTNELQRQVVYLLAGGDADRLLGRKLFVVGDAKQSIYRFRGADVAVFERVKADIAASGGETIELAVNFRSAGRLLAFYNECFTALMGTALDMVPFSPLVAHRADAPPLVRAELLVIPRDNPAGGLPVRTAEASAIARRIRLLVDSGPKLIGQSDCRRANYRDIAILFRTAGDIGVYTAALQAESIPFYIVGGRGFYQCQEIIDILNLLRVVDNRFRETALVGVLRSPMFMLSDPALVWLKRSGGSLWRGLEQHAANVALSDEQRSAAGRAWRVLSTLRGLRGLVNVGEIVEQALTETGYLDFVLTQFMGRQQYANLLKFTAVARAYVTKGPATLGDFLRYVAKLIDSEVREGEAQIETETGNAVRLMTIHKAKGLEFPVVVVPDLQRKFKDETAPALFNPDFGLGIKVPDATGELTGTTLYTMIAGRERELAWLELKRVLYVAMTRAKDYLILSGVGSRPAKDKDYTEINNWLGWLDKACDLKGCEELPDQPPGPEAALLVQAAPALSARPEPTAVAAGELPCPQLDQIKVNIGPLRAGPTDALLLSVSDLVRFRQCPRAFFYQRIAGLPDVAGVSPATAAGPPGFLTGTAVHRCLELLGSGPDWPDCLARAITEVVPARWRDAVSDDAIPLVRDYVAGELQQRLTATPLRKEWRFNYYFGEAPAGRQTFALAGRVDCLAEYADGTFGLVDYKTDRVIVAETESRAAEHAWQLVLYALAVEAAWQRPVSEAWLYFLRSRQAVSVRVDAAAKTAAVAKLTAIGQFIDSHPAEQDYVCRSQSCAHCGYRPFCAGTI